MIATGQVKKFAGEPFWHADIVMVNRQSWQRITVRGSYKQMKHAMAAGRRLAKRLGWSIIEWQKV